MKITTETATVYRGGGRRWFTKDAASRAEARAKIRTRCDCSRHRSFHPRDGDEEVCIYHADMVRYCRIVRRLAWIYKKAM